MQVCTCVSITTDVIQNDFMHARVQRLVVDVDEVPRKTRNKFAAITRASIYMYIYLSRNHISPRFNPGKKWEILTSSRASTNNIITIKLNNFSK